MEACRATAEPGFWYSGSAGLDLCNSRYPRKSSVPTAFKRAKKNQKKTCQTLAPSAKGKLRSDKCRHFVVQKNSKKVKKKLVRALEIE